MLQNAYCLFHRKRIYRVGTIIEACIFFNNEYYLLSCGFLQTHHSLSGSSSSNHSSSSSSSKSEELLLSPPDTSVKDMTQKYNFARCYYRYVDLDVFFLLTHRYPIVCSCGSCSFLVCWEHQSRTTINNQLLLTPIPYENLGKLCQTCHIAILNSRICFS